MSRLFGAKKLSARAFVTVDKERDCDKVNALDFILIIRGSSWASNFHFNFILIFLFNCENLINIRFVLSLRHMILSIFKVYRKLLQKIYDMNKRVTNIASNFLNRSRSSPTKTFAFLELIICVTIKIFPGMKRVANFNFCS